MRVEIAHRAERTLDVQYFLLHQDGTGKLLLKSLLEAADRGVRVRLLLDDVEAFDLTEVDGRTIWFSADPDVDAGKRAMISIFSMLPLESLL